MKRLSIRWKMTLWYGGVLTIVLTMFGAVVFGMMRHHLFQRIDQGLNEELADVLSEIRRAINADGLKEWLNRRFAAHAGFDFLITKPNGERFFANPRLDDKEWPTPAPTSESEKPYFATVPIASSGRWRIVSVKAPGPDVPLIVQVGRSLAAFEHESNELLATLLLAGPLTLLAAISGGYFLASRLLRPVQAMTKAAKIISADRLSERIVVVDADDELGELGQTLNAMIERLEQSFTEMQRFTADAAHELRTPLAIIRNEAEVALRLPRTGDDYRNVLENLLEEVQRISTMADQLLFLSRQDAGLSPKVREDVALDELLREVVQNMQLVAQAKDVAIQLTDNVPCRLNSDSRLLRRVFVNLLDNAIKYADRAGIVRVCSRLSTDDVAIQVQDDGPGISAEHQPHIFDRFYRADAARSGDGNGVGLGLSICQSIVNSLGGAIRVEGEQEKGTTVTVSLPRFDAHAS